MDLQRERIKNLNSIRGIIKKKVFLGSLFRIVLDVDGNELTIDFQSNQTLPEEGEHFEPEFQTRGIHPNPILKVTAQPSQLSYSGN